MRTHTCARTHIYVHTHTHTHIYMHIMYTGCFRGNLPCFRRMSLRLNHINITKNAYRTFTEIMAKGVLKNGNCYGIIDYKIHIKTRIKLKCTKFWHLYLTSNQHLSHKKKCIKWEKRAKVLQNQGLQRLCVTHSPPYGLPWLSAQGRTCIEYGEGVTLKWCSALNRKKTTLYIYVI